MAVFVIFFLPGAWEAQIILGLCALAGCVAIHWLWYPRLVEARVRSMKSYCQKQLSGKHPFLVEVEVSPVGLRVKQLGKGIIHAWAEIEGVQERDDSVDVLTRRAGLVAIPKRAFASQAETDKFVELIQTGREGHAEQICTR